MSITILDSMPVMPTKLSADQVTSLHREERAVQLVNILGAKVVLALYDRKEPVVFSEGTSPDSRCIYAPHTRDVGKLLLKHGLLTNPPPTIIYDYTEMIARTSQNIFQSAATQALKIS